MHVGLLSSCNVYCGNCAVHKKSECKDVLKKAEKLKRRGKYSVTYILVLEAKNSPHVLTVGVILAISMMKRFFLRASLSG